MKSPKDIFRPTISNDEVFLLLDMMDQARSGTLQAFHPGLREFYKKVDRIAYDIGKGQARPAYVATGIKRESAINMDSLGATAKEKEYAHMSEEQQFAELERLNQEMLAEMGIPTGIDTDNSADTLALGSDDSPTDSDNMFDAFKNRNKQQ